MAEPQDIRESFPTLEDSSGVGAVLSKSLEGDAASGKIGSVGFAFKDSSGNLVLPQLDSMGRLSITSDATGVRYRGHGVVAGGLISASAGDYIGLQQVMSVSLVANQTIGDIAGKVASRRGALFRLYYQDAGGSSVILDDTLVDSGQYTASLGLGPSEDTFAVPASASSPALVVMAGNFEKATDLHATLSVLQF